MWMPWVRPSFLISRWRWSEPCKSGFNGNFWSQMVAATSWRPLLQFILLIFPNILKIFSCSSDGQKSLPKNILSAISFYRSAIGMKGWEPIKWTNFTSNAKYGDTLHPYASKQFVHLQNYILSHTNRCVYMSFVFQSTMHKCDVC